MKRLANELQAINKKIKMINKRHPTFTTPDKQNSYLRGLKYLLDQAEGSVTLNVRESMDRVLGSGPIALPYELISKDDLMDVFITYNSLDTQTTIVAGPNTTLYPLLFPYVGARGPRVEIEQIFLDYLGKTASDVIPFVLGNEPINITPWNFKTTSILKSPSELAGRGTLIGIIDTGIDYTNPVFMDSEGRTRIVSIWDQTVGTASPYGYGTVYDKEDINKALASKDPFELLPHKDEWGHGTILAGIAAGAGKYDQGSYQGVAPGAELVIVKLKPANDTIQTFYHGFYNPLGFSALDIALATEFMVNLANQIKKPISICLPMGTNTGPHDGSTPLDSIISRYSSNPGVATVISVGDEANKAHHARGDLKEEKVQQINLTIAKGQVSFIVEIWAMFGDRIEVFLTPPESEDIIVQEIMLNMFQQYPLAEESSVWSEGVMFDNTTGCQRIRFRLNNPIPGEWIITVKGIVLVEGHYNIWIPKIGMILPGTVLSPSNPFTTIYNTSAAVGIIAIGCHDGKSQSACAGSGRGFTRNNRPSPDYIADGIDIPGPLPSNKWGLISGSAPASAITVGVTSLVYEEQLAQGDDLANTSIMKAILTDKVKRQPTVLYPNPSSGYGVININSN